MTPNLAVVQFQNPHWRGMRLWVPLFLLWIPFLMLAPLLLLVLCGLCIAGRMNLWRAIAAFWDVTCSLPGTDVQVRSDANQVRIRIY